ncbi:hypothetical protein GCM10028808_73570 [Spirosoma migulaei]
MKIFIGSSKEQYNTLVEIANIVESNGHIPVRWDEPGLFRPGSFILNRLVEIANDVDASIIIFAEDDKVWYRYDITTQPRDNVIFEHGIFTGVLGSENAIILKVGSAKIASDLGGINYIDFSEGKKQRGHLELIQWLKNLKSKKSLSEINHTINDYFYTLDDAYKTHSTFVDLIENAKKVYVLARTAVNLLGNYDREIIQSVRSGTDVRLLFVGPTSDAVKYIYGDDSSIYFSNAKKMEYHLKRIRQETGKQITVKTINHAPTLSIIYIKKNNGESFVVIQFYFLHSRISRDRPMFRLNEGDIWFSAFKDEFDKLWSNADNWSFNED